MIAGVYYWHKKSTTVAVDGDHLQLYGNVDIREIHVTFYGSEHVSQMLVDEGDQVKKGQLLATLQTDRLQTTVDRSQAELVAAKAEAHAAKLNYQRILSLAKRKLASKSQSDVAEANSRAASAHVVAAEAILSQTKQALKDANLYAPTNGVIRERIVEPGDFVTPQSPVYTLALVNPVWVRAYIPEKYLGKIKPGTPAQITTDSYPGKVYKAWIGSISPTAEFTPKNVETPDLRTRLVYQVRVFACNPHGELRLGMPATVKLSLNEAAKPLAPEARCASTPEK